VAGEHFVFSLHLVVPATQDLLSLLCSPPVPPPLGRSVGRFPSLLLPCPPPDMRSRPLSLMFGLFLGLNGMFWFFFDGAVVRRRWFPLRKTRPCKGFLSFGAASGKADAPAFFPFFLGFFFCVLDDFCVSREYLVRVYAGGIALKITVFADGSVEGVSPLFPCVTERELFYC